ncbi:SlyX protein [Pseudomonas flavescens]|uniref:Protein SlyX homolog n=1 Tax=Phytopseudomonas flavescens TaxID=29435 RepID=A0A1G8JCR5_9GAMM|nr:SlyX family protein [Pseudomonas flavescens]SDI28871.1 SlyX protein [Pseudomonas flavescens]
MKAFEDRIVELESRQAFQDDTIQALNDALVEQQKLIERLQLHMQALAKRQEEVSPFGGSQYEAPPPHY